MQRATLHSLAVTGLVILAATAAACYSDPQTVPAPARTQFVVRNDGFYDANVYVALSDGRKGWRLGTVTGNSARVFELRAIDLQPGDVLRVRVHPIGTRVDWLSPAVIVGSDEIPELRLIADARGALDMSSFYTRVRLVGVAPPH